MSVELNIHLIQLASIAVLHVMVCVTAELMA